MDFEIRDQESKKKYWVIRFLLKKTQFEQTPVFFKNVNPYKKFFKDFDFKHSAFLFKNHEKFSFKLKLKSSNKAEFLREWQIKTLNNIFSDRIIRTEHINILSNPYYNDYLFISLEKQQYYNLILEKVMMRYTPFMKKYQGKKQHHVNTNNSLININFLRKERLYTKLKYSRSPAYDIVSGGSAALLAAFLGFLISEKYGFELVDSGDFYYLFMYLVFLAFAFKPLITTVSHNENFINIFSPKIILNFFLDMFYLILKKFKL